MTCVGAREPYDVVPNGKDDKSAGMMESFYAKDSTANFAKRYVTLLRLLLTQEGPK